MECFPVECTPLPDQAAEYCTQGPSLGIPCDFSNATTACPANAACNMAPGNPSAGAGWCAPLPTTEGADCSFYNGYPQCGAGLMCLMGTAVCGKAAGGLDQPCPLLPDRCDVARGLTCISEQVEPFASSCRPARKAGEQCASGGEWCVLMCMWYVYVYI